MTLVTVLLLMLVPPVVFWAVYIIREPYVWSRITRKGWWEFVGFKVFKGRHERHRFYYWVDYVRAAWQAKASDVYYDNECDLFYNTGEAIPEVAIWWASLEWFVQQAVTSFYCIRNGHEYEEVYIDGHLAYGPCCERCMHDPIGPRGEC